MKYLLTFIIAGITLPSFGQIKPTFFPEDVTPGAIEAYCYCKPGVRNKSKSKGLKLNYTIINAGELKPEDQPLSDPLSEYERIHQFELDLKAPVYRGETFKLLVGYEFFTEKVKFERIGADYSDAFRELDRRRLKKSTFNVLATKILDEKHYLAFRMGYASNGDYHGFIRFHSRYAIYKGVALFVRKPNQDFEWGVGLNVSQSFRKINVLPFLLLNKTFNDHWGIESLLPANVQLRYNINPKNLLLGGFEYESQSYRFGVPNPPADELDYAFNHSEVVASVKLEHQVTSWLWSKVKVGWQVNFSTDFESKSAGTPSFRVEPTNGGFFQVGMFLSPPEELFGKNGK